MFLGSTGDRSSAKFKACSLQAPGFMDCGSSTNYCTYSQKHVAWGCLTFSGTIVSEIMSLNCNFAGSWSCVNMWKSCWKVLLSDSVGRICRLNPRALMNMKHSSFQRFRVLRERLKPGSGCVKAGAAWAVFQPARKGLVI